MGEGRDLETEFADAVARLERALAALGATLAEVVRTLVYVTDPSEITRISAAHRRAIGAAPPTATVALSGGSTAGNRGHRRDRLDMRGRPGDAFVLATAQCASTWNDLDRNAATHLALAEKAATLGARIEFPALSLTGYPDPTELQVTAASGEEAFFASGNTAEPLQIGQERVALASCADAANPDHGEFAAAQSSRPAAAEHCTAS